MKSTGAWLIPALALTFLAGCGASKAEPVAAGSPAADRGAEPDVVGVYDLDNLAMKAAMFALPVDPDLDAMGRQLREEMLGRFDDATGTLDVKADGTLTLTLKIPRQPDSGSKNGTWQLDGERMAITIPNPMGEPETRPARCKDGVIAIPVAQNGQVIEMLWRRRLTEKTPK